MYRPSRQLASFHIAGFKYWDGALVLDQLRPGRALDLVPEPDNPYDSKAVALYLGTAKLGYVPRTDNAELSVLCFYGHGGIFECRVLQANPEASPWEQVLVGIYVRDATPVRGAGHEAEPVRPAPDGERSVGNSFTIDPAAQGASSVTVTVEPLDE